MSIDPFAGYVSHPFPAFDNMIPVVPSDDDELDFIASALYSSSYGIVKISTAGGQRLSIPVPGPGLVAPVRIRKVWATDTTIGTAGADGQVRGVLYALW